MAKKKAKKRKTSESLRGKSPICRKFLKELDASTKMLITLRDELYDGSFEEMRDDLEERLNGKPYIYKLIQRIEADIERIDILDEFEKKPNVNLAGYLAEMESKV